MAEGKRSVVILPSDFDIALKSTKQVEKNTQESHWEKTKQFAKDNPVLAGIIGSAIIAGAGFAAYHFFVHKPQMAQSAAQHTASMQQSAEQHTKTMGQAARHHLQNAKLSVLIHEDSLCHAEMLHNDGIETTETLQRELTKRNEEFQKGLQENMKEDSKKLHDAGQQQADHHHNENMNWDKTKTACTGTSAAVAAALFAGDLVTGGTATTIVATGSTVGPMVCDGIAWTYRNGVGAAANKVWDETKGVTGSTWNGTIWVASKTWGGTKYVASGCWNKVTGLFS